MGEGEKVTKVFFPFHVQAFIMAFGPNPYFK